MENTMRPNGMVKLNSLFCNNKLIPFYVKTYKYIYPLYKNVKIELKELPYPEYDKGFELINDYKHNSLLVFRSYILARLYGWKDEMEIIKKYIYANYSGIEIKEHMETSMENKSIISLVEKNKGDNNFFVNNK